MKKILRNILCFVIIMGMIAAGIPSITVLAKDAGNSSSSEQKESQPEMEDGIITITLSATAATTGTYWQTVGFYVTTKTTGKCGSTRSSDWKNILWLTDANVDNKTENGIVKSIFTFPWSKVRTILKNAGISDTSTTIYFQGVLRGYTYRNGKKVWITDPCYTLQQMQYTRKHPGIGWKSSCDDGWKERYDLPLTLDTPPADVTVNYFMKVAGSNSTSDKTFKKLLSYRNDENEIADSGLPKWIDRNQNYGSILEGNGLGFSRLEYKQLTNKVAVTKYNAPQKLSRVIGEYQLIRWTNGTEYYVYKIAWSYGSSKTSSTTGVKPCHGTYTFNGNILNSDGNLSDAYQTAYKEMIDLAYRVVDDEKGMELNIFYKKGNKKGKDQVDSSSTAIIQSDDRGNEEYDSTEGIPTSETQYVNVFTDDYLYVYKTSNVSGSNTYPQLRDEERTGYGSYTDEEGNTHSYTYTYTVTVTDYVSRSYSYNVVESYAVYKIDRAVVNNYSLPGGSVTLTPSAYYEIPTASMSKTGHYDDPDGVGTYSVGETKCYNDTVIFMGQTIMDGSMHYSAAPESGTIPPADKCNRDVLYKKNLLIDPDKTNGYYESDGTVAYRAVINYNSGQADVLTFDIDSINEVVIHTPTICNLSVSDVKEYNQMITPDYANSGIVLDRNFTVTFSTYGYHSQLKGYGTRNYAQFIAKKEVRFPFDVYTTDSDGKPDIYIPSGTWVEIEPGRFTKEFYLPTWVTEENYVIDGRARAINCDANVLDGIDADGVDEALQAASQHEANANLEYYVASNEVNVQISGRIYGLTLYDISDYPNWQSVFRRTNSLQPTGVTYTVGNRDQNGTFTGRLQTYTFPMINGSHPKIINLGSQKTGYVSRFYLTTVGNMYDQMDSISITPQFYYIDASGIRQKVDVYYDASINGVRKNMVKIGSDMEAGQLHSMTLGNVYTSVPEAELQSKAKVEGLTLAEAKASKGMVYTFSHISIPSALRTYIGNRYYPNGILPADVDETTALASVQKWYFEYYIPSDIYVCQSGYDVVGYARDHNGVDGSEGFWKSPNGYLLVSFDIQTVDGQTGKRLSYINNGNTDRCNMWKLEGFSYEKTTSNGITYQFRDGDILTYYLNKSASRDYQARGTH